VIATVVSVLPWAKCCSGLRRITEAVLGMRMPRRELAVLLHAIRSTAIRNKCMERRERTQEAP
jgi:hypothetical protein